MTFKEWVLHFKDVDRPIGDLATDISKDPEFPIENNKELIRDYLSDKAQPAIVLQVLETFDNAWSYYEKDI